jgi:hypothetical protein
VTTTSPAEAAVADVSAGLRAALDQLAAAMTLGDADAVLAVEPVLQAAVSRETATMTNLASTERDVVLHDLARARAALARCRALGAGAALVTGATLEALGRAPFYSRHGAGTSRDPRRRGLKARV